MAQHNLTGGEGESLAVGYLKDQGYEIVKTNWRVGRLEVDIIAKRNDVLHFVEVKTRSGRIGDDFQAEHALSFSKRDRLIKAANEYVRLTGVDVELSLDLAAVTFWSDGRRDLRFYEHVEF